MPNKWFFRIGSFLFAFALLVGCANDDNNPDNDQQPGDAPMEDEQENDGNNLEEDLEEEGNNMENEMEDNIDDMEENMDMDGEGNNQEEDSDMLEHENEHGETE